MSEQQLTINHLVEGSQQLFYQVAELENPAGIALPLGRGDSQTESDFDGESAAGVAYVTPKLSWPVGDTDDHLQNCREGYLYIFVNGYIWHEYQVAEHGVLNAINLQYTQGLDERQASGRPVRKMLLPTLINGEPPEVQVAFSAVQWSWQRIVRLGGMAPDDPRAVHIVKQGETLCSIAPLYGCIQSTKAMAELNGLADPNSIQQGQALQVRPADQPPENANTSREARMGPCLLALIENEQLAINDPLGYVEAINNAMTSLLISQQQLVSEMQGEFIRQQTWLKPGERAQSPLYMASALASVEPILAPVDLGADKKWKQEDWAELTEVALLVQTVLNPQSDQLSEESQQQIELAKNALDLDLLNRWLRVGERQALRDEFRQLQQKLIEQINSDCSDFDQNPYPASLLGTLEDFAYLRGAHYARLWVVFADLLNHLPTDPHQADKQFDTHSIQQAEHSARLTEGVDLLYQVFTGKHQVSEWLFPNEADIDLSSEASPEFNQLAQTITSAFRPAEFAQAMHSDMVYDDTGTTAATYVKGSMDILTRFVKSVAAIAKAYKAPEQIRATQNLVMRLSKATKLPLLENLHLVKAGEVTSGKAFLGQYRVEKVALQGQQQMTRGERRSQAQQTMADANKTRDVFNEQLVQLLSPEGEVLGTSKVGAVNPFDGTATSSVPDTKNWMELFVQTASNQGGDPLVTAKVDLWMLPEQTALMGAWKQASQRMQNSDIFTGALKGLPCVMLLLEVHALQGAFAAASKDYETSGVRLAGMRFLGQFASIAGAIVDIFDTWHGQDRFINLLGSAKYKLLRAGAVRVPLPRTNLVVPLARWLGPIGSFLSAVFNAKDAWQLFSDRDTDAAIAMATVAVLGVAGAAVGLVGGAIGLSAGASMVLPIIGLAIAAVCFALVWAIDKWWKDKPLEKWAKFSPFAKQPEARLDHDDYASITASGQQLKNMLWQPSASSEAPVTIGNKHRVKVRIEHPSFMVGTSDLYYEATSQQQVFNSYNNRTTIARNSHQVHHPIAIQTEQRNNQTIATILTFEADDEADLQLQGMNRAQQTYEVNINRSRLWTLKFRHQLAANFSLPINDTITDHTTNDETGWCTHSWTTA